MRGTGNKYVYADNDPLAKVDISGLVAVTIDDGLEVAEYDGYTFDNPFQKPESSPPQSQTTGGQTTTTPSSGNGSSSSTQTASGQQAANATVNAQAGQPVKEAQNHGFWWKLGHALGLVKTPEELHQEAQFYRQHVPGMKDMSDQEILHVVHTVMAMSMPGEGALGEAGETAEGVGSAAADANKLNHIFGKAAHNLDGLVSEFGSQEAAYNALQKATQEVVSQKGLTGVFETSVTVGSQTVTVRGAVVDGVAKIGTAFQ